MLNIRDLIEDPNYLAYKFDFDTEILEFLPLNDGDLQRATWLKRDVIGLGRTAIEVPLAELVSALNSDTIASYNNAPRFIFHTAFCASTFLTRCLSVEGVSVCLREPQLLLDAANAKRLRWRSKSHNFDFRHFPTMAIRLLQKHASANESLIIKPINSVNNIIPELLQISGTSKALMLYTDARNFLLSTLKKGEEAKQTVRAMFDLLRCDFTHTSQLRLTDAIHMSDLKITLTLWRLQLEQAEYMLKRFETNGAMNSLHAEKLIEDPLRVLQAANRFLDLGLTDKKIKEICNGDVRFTDAKDTEQRFSATKRSEIYHSIEAFHGKDLDRAYTWLTNNNPATLLEPSLSSALKL